MAALLGARRVVVTDYPAPVVMSNLRANVARNVRAEMSPLLGGGGNGGGGSDDNLPPAAVEVEVEGHSWGDFSSSSGAGGSAGLSGRGAFDRVLVCDCLWMPWQHENLLRSVGWFLKDDGGEAARCWVVAGFHTGREKLRGFFEEGRLRAVGLEVERIWERDCDGVEREWAWDRGYEDPAGRKRWLVCAVLKRREGSGLGGSNGSEVVDAGGNVEAP